MRGGARFDKEGKLLTGRKLGSTKTDNRKKMSITLPMDLVEWLREQDLSQAKTIEKALLSYIKDGKSVNFTSAQYTKIQDFIIYNRLYKGWPDSMSHADIIIELAKKSL